MVNHYTLPVAKRYIWGLLALMIAPIIGVSQNVTTGGEQQLAPPVACEDLAIENISWTNESVCDAADGQLFFNVSDLSGTAGETYRLEMDFGTKVMAVEGLTVSDGQIVLSDLYPTRYGNFVLTRESDNCSSAVFPPESFGRTCPAGPL